MNRYLRAGLISLVVSTLLFSRQIANFSAADSRYYWTWDHQDAAALILSVFAFALIGLGLYALVQKINKPRLTNVMGHLWIVLLVIGVLSNVDRLRDVTDKYQYVWVGALIAGLIVSMLRPSLRLVDRAGSACVVFSLLPLILLGQIVTWNSWRTPKEQFVPAREKPDATPVFIFSFDAMGWEHLHEPGSDEIKAIFPSLKRLSQTAYRFPEGRSAASSTSDSLPRMVYQLNALFRVPGVSTPPKSVTEPSFILKGLPVPAAKLPSMFSLAKDNGYQSSMVTFYLPWRAILGQQGDYIHVYNEEPHGRNFLERCWLTIVRNVQYYPYPHSGDVWSRIYARIYSDNWNRINQDMQREVFQLVQASPDSTLGFYHFPLPHAPFIFGADGKYLGPYKGSRMHGRLSEYIRHLRYADRVIGNLVRKLQQSEKFDKALVIITSDHGWVPNKGAVKNVGEVLKHNMLMIKLPGQTTPGVIREPIENTSLSGLMELAMQGKLTDESFRTEMVRIALPPPKPKSPATKPTTRGT